MTSMRDQAVRLSSHFKVHPIRERAKKPAIDPRGWGYPKGSYHQHIPSSDPERVAQMWTAPDGMAERHNIAINTEGLFVLDVDDRPATAQKVARTGTASLAKLVAEHGLDLNTVIVETPTHGRHYYYKLPPGVDPKTIAGNSDKLGSGIDHRSYNNYVLAPGSILPSGEYKYVNPPESYEITTVPQSVLDLLPKREPNGKDHVPVIAPGVVLDTPDVIARARQWLREYAPEAIEGCCGDDTTVKIVAPRLGDFGCSAPVGWELMLEDWNDQKASPPWDPDELWVKVHNGYAARQNPLGCDHPTAQFDVVVGEPPKTNGHDKTPVPLILSSDEFLKDFIPPDYLIDGILQRRFFYWFTARTGSAKTAICLLLAAYVAKGRMLGKRDIPQGDVLYFAGENPDDIRMRWIAMQRLFDLDPENANRVHFVTGVHKLSQIAGRIRREVEEKKLQLSLVVVDTSQAYFEGTDDNNNVEMLHHALRMRSLVDLPGGPTVLVAAHPVKNAADDNLLPRGGSAALNEADGNITSILKSETMAEVHWQGKFRGPDFAPLIFGIYVVTDPRLIDSKGREIPTVIARPMTTEEEQAAAATATEDENDLLRELGEGNGRTGVSLAELLEWKMRDGQPHRMRVHRAAESLKKDGLILMKRRKYYLTKAGKAELAGKEEAE